MIGFNLQSHIKALACDQSFSTHQIIDDGIPDDIAELFEKIAPMYDICPELMEAMAYRESRFIPTVREGNCYGIMQVNVKIHKERIEKYDFTADDMFDAEKCIIVSADYLKELFDTYGDDDPIVLGAYSGNWKAVARYKETSMLFPYADDVLKRSRRYEEIHGKILTK